MGPCGGRIEPAIGNVGQVGDAPFDVHLVSFPDLARADSCASNPETPNLSSHRSEIAFSASILEGRQAGRCQADVPKTLG